MNTLSAGFQGWLLLDSTPVLHSTPFHSILLHSTPFHSITGRKHQPSPV